jgi:hypothetical protein
VAGVQLASRHDPRAEAELQARLVPRGMRRATLYGVGQGELVRVLLERRELERLRVLVLSPAHLAAVLGHLAADWLEDERLLLVQPGPQDELELPFAAAPACLRGAVPEAARLRDLVVLELATPHIRRHQRALEQECLQRLAESEQRFASDRQVGELFGTRPGAEVAVLAAGPSLAEHYAELRTRARPLIAVDAALAPLLEQGIVPDLVLSIDAHEEGMRRVFDLPRGPLRACTLVYFPVVPPEVLRAWPGPRLVARGTSPLYRSWRPAREIATLFCSGCVLHPAVDLGCRLGAARIELYGADFALPGGQSHVSGCAWQFAFEPSAGGAWVEDRDGRALPSLPNLVGYLRDLERYIASHPQVLFVNRSRTGARILGAVAGEASPVA